MQSSTTSLLDEAKDRQKLPFAREEYNLTERSTFLDIGSGFGKPVFHAAMQTYCLSRGIEVVPARVLASNDIKYEIEDVYLKKYGKKSPIKAKSIQTIQDQLISSAELVNQTPP